MSTKPSGRRELLAALLEWATNTRGESGVVSAHVCEDVEEVHAYSLTSKWRSQADLERHLTTAGFAVLVGAINVLADKSQIELLQELGPDEPAAFIMHLRGRVHS